MAEAADPAEFYAEQLQIAEKSLQKAIDRRHWIDEKLSYVLNRRASLVVKRQHQNTLIQQLRDRRASVRVKLHDALEP